MRIHQLNVRYDNEQDRLLARINTDTAIEMSLWLTRRLTLGVLPLLRKFATEQLERDAVLLADTAAPKDPHVRQALGEFKKEVVLRQSDFNTPYKEPEAAAATEAPLLVCEVAMTPLSSGQLQVKFRGPMVTNLTRNDQTRKEVQIELDNNLLHGFLHLVEKAFASSGWAVSAVLPLEPEPAATDAASPARPQYLN
jgi:hypothetical protein